MKVQFRSLEWVDWNKSKQLDWWIIDVKLDIDGKHYNLNIVFEEYFDIDGAGIGSGFLISRSPDMNTLSYGLWGEKSRFKNIKKKKEVWMIEDKKGIDVWMEIENYIYEWNGYGFKDEGRHISDEDIKGLVIEID